MKSNITVNTLAPAAYSRMTEDLMPEDVEEALAPEKVSPAVVFLCTDDAKSITGRQFAVRGNKVALLSWQVTDIAERSSREDAWTVEAIGERILDGMGDWPKTLKPNDV